MPGSKYMEEKGFRVISTRTDPQSVEAVKVAQKVLDQIPHEVFVEAWRKAWREAIERGEI